MWSLEPSFPLCLDSRACRACSKASTAFWSFASSCSATSAARAEQFPLLQPFEVTQHPRSYPLGKLIPARQAAPQAFQKDGLKPAPPLRIITDLIITIDQDTQLAYLPLYLVKRAIIVRDIRQQLPDPFE